MRKIAFIPAATMSIAAPIFACPPHDDHPGRMAANRCKINEVAKRYSWYRQGKHASA